MVMCLLSTTFVHTMSHLCFGSFRIMTHAEVFSLLLKEKQPELAKHMVHKFPYCDIHHPHYTTLTTLPSIRHPPYATLHTLPSIRYPPYATLHTLPSIHTLHTLYTLHTPSSIHHPPYTTLHTPPSLHHPHYTTLHAPPSILHFKESLGVHPLMYVTSWFMCLFTTLPCWDTVLTICDLLFLEGKVTSYPLPFSSCQCSCYSVDIPEGWIRLRERREKMWRRRSGR